MNPRAAIVAVGLGLSMGCAGAEQELIERYLAASQQGDNDTLAALSMVAFPEEVESWNVLEIGMVRREPYLLPELRQDVGRVEDERDVQSKVFGEFRQGNYEALRRIGERLRVDAEYHFPGRLGELQDEWELLRLERRQVVAKLHDAEIAFEQEIRRVNKSLERESNSEHLTGEILKKDALVRVTTPDGDKRYSLSLSRYELTNPFDALVPARWIITAVTPADQHATFKASSAWNEL